MTLDLAVDFAKLLLALALATLFGARLPRFGATSARSLELVAVALVLFASTLGSSRVAALLLLGYTFGRTAMDADQRCLHLLPTAALAASALGWNDRHGEGLLSAGTCLLAILAGHAAMASRARAALGCFACLALGAVALAAPPS